MDSARVSRAGFGVAPERTFVRVRSGRPMRRRKGQNRPPRRLFEKNARFPGSPVFNVYRAGCEEMTFHLLGSPEVDDTFRARLGIADKISPAQMGAVNAAMERAVGETALSLESQMILLATAVSGSPFLGLLGTVWGVMDAFTGVAEAGSPNLVSMAPGVYGDL